MPRKRSRGSDLSRINGAVLGFCSAALILSCQGIVTPGSTTLPGSGGSGGKTQTNSGGTVGTSSGGAGPASGGSGPGPGSGGAGPSSGGSPGSGGAVSSGGSGTASGGSGTGSGGRANGGSGGATGTGGRANTGGTGTATGGSTGSGGGSSAGCPPACGPGVTDFYDNGKLATIRLTFDAADTGTYTPAQWLDLLWSKHNHCPPFDKSDLVRVTFQYESPDSKGNATLQDVGMRLRGGMPKGYNQLAGFKLDFQKWLGTATGPARRRFGDINRLNTLSVEADPSHIMQCLAYKMLRDFGNPAPYCNHLKVYANGTLYGTMENIEEPETGRFVAHHFGEAAVATAEVYEGSPSQDSCTGTAKYNDGAAKLAYLGDSFSSYPQMYKITRGTTANAEAHLIPMLKCGDATSTASDATFKTCISEWLDVNEWLRQIAAESLMPTVESSMVMRNFLLYFVPDASAPHGGRFQIGSWDLDVSFQKASCYPSNCDPFTSTASFFGPGGTRPKLYTRLTTVFKAEYCTALKNFLTNVYKPAAVDQMATVAGMTGTDANAIKTYITSHGSSAMTQVTSACP